MRNPFRRRSQQEERELEEWDYHHNDPRSEQGFGLFRKVATYPDDLDDEELHRLWAHANRLVGQRAPADYGEFLAYGYLEGLKIARSRMKRR